jgi:hypothetical protein
MTFIRFLVKNGFDLRPKKLNAYANGKCHPNDYLD